MTEKMAATTAHTATITFTLRTSEGDDRPVYIAGNFNNWQAADRRFQLQEQSPGVYILQLNKSSLPTLLEYKYLRNHWDGVELNEAGEERNNRRLNLTQHFQEDLVPRWKEAAFSFQSSFLPIIRTINENFSIPQLIRTRRISALLPYNYDQTDRRYPVLYLQDGQNLFDDFAPFGNWAVDRQLALLAEKGMADIIIIAIDHAAEQRIVEYTPSGRTHLGKGEGKKYARFLADTLKPYIDANFRTLPDRKHTGIGGSSMGGLISIYAAMIYPEVYGNLMVFSPSLWVLPKVPFSMAEFSESFGGRVYLYGGRGESKKMVPSLERLKAAMEQQATDVDLSIHLAVDPDGQHNEIRWGQEFPQAVQWLFFHDR